MVVHLFLHQLVSATDIFSAKPEHRISHFGTHRHVLCGPAKQSWIEAFCCLLIRCCQFKPAERSCFRFAHRFLHQLLKRNQSYSSQSRWQFAPEHSAAASPRYFGTATMGSMALI